MLDLALLVGKILFLVVLYWFVLMIVRSATRDLRAAGSSAPGSAAPPAALPAQAPPGSLGPTAGVAGPASSARGPVAVGGGGRGLWALVVMASPALEPGWAYEFPPGGLVVVGRSEEADIVLGDTFVSSRHARVRALPGAVEVEDLGSTNGTFVNGRELEGPVLVGPGDELSVGDTLFRVEAR